MEIRGTSSLQASQAMRGPSSVNTIDSSSQIAHPDVVDQLDISAEAQAASSLGDVSDVRAARVAEIKAQIAEGTYETNEKLDVAVNRMINELA